jgi:hypothetical protein
MSSSESGRRESGAQQQPTSTERVLPSGQATDPALLERVLRQTLTVCGSNEPLDAGSRKALREVVARHRGRPFSLEPVAVELVAAVLRANVEATSSSLDTWRAVSFQVARTLCDDPASRKRLEAFWGRLSQR